MLPGSRAGSTPLRSRPASAHCDSARRNLRLAPYAASWNPPGCALRMFSFFRRGFAERVVQARPGCCRSRRSPSPESSGGRGSSRSADIPCRNTPAQAASFGESPWRRAPRSSRSGRPPSRPRPCTVPVVLMKMSPFGVATIVRAPLRITVTRSSSARCRAESIRDTSIDSMVFLRQPRHLPGWE